MNKTPIEWTDYTWNPVTGCSKISQGCKHCYAETLTNRFGKVWNQPSFRTITCHNDRLSEPFMMFGKLRGKKVFVCDMSDLFHEQVSFIFLLSVYQQFSLCPDTTFQVLTKRPERALEFYLWAGDSIAHIKNVWLGVSIEDQKAADERIPLLLKIPVTVRFLSCEPLLGMINLNKINYVKGSWIDSLNDHPISSPGKTLIQWVIAGGESGNRKTVRPMHPDWARSLRDQCKAAGVPFFFKQWGQYKHEYEWKESLDSNAAEPNFEKELTFYKVGKSKSGNLLDGVQHLEFPINN